MREGKPSFTAAAVATARGVANVDPYAGRLVEGGLGWVLRLGRRGRLPAAIINRVTLGLVDHIEVRTRAIDDALRAGLAAGMGQLVILGAGLDARAWRMPELAGVRVFEVDHPSTQAYKRPRVEASAAAAREVRFVAVDFEREALEPALAAAGHDAGAATFWIWEGVTPYLPLEAVRSTLAAVSARSAADSRIAVTYARPRGSALGPHVLRVGLRGFRLMGEELRGLIETRALHEELEAVGFHVVEDLSAAECGARFGGSRGRWLLLDEHLAVARREDSRIEPASSAARG